MRSRAERAVNGRCDMGRRCGLNQVFLLGKIEPGRRGDLLVLSRDPTLDVHAIDGIEQVWLAGVRLDRDALLKH